MIKKGIDGDSSETAPAPSKEIINTRDTSVIYSYISSFNYLNVFKVGDING